MKLDKTIAQLTVNRMCPFHDTHFVEWILLFSEEVEFTPGRFISILHQNDNEWRKIINFPDGTRQILPLLTIDEEKILEIEFTPIDGTVYDNPSVNSSARSGNMGYVMSLALTEAGVAFSLHLKEEYLRKQNLKEETDVMTLNMERYLKVKNYIVPRSRKIILTLGGIMVAIFPVLQTYDTALPKKVVDFIIQQVV